MPGTPGATGGWGQEGPSPEAADGSRALGHLDLGRLATECETEFLLVQAPQCEVLRRGPRTLTTSQLALAKPRPLLLPKKPGEDSPRPGSSLPTGPALGKPLTPRGAHRS